jgi:hypothetical protein
VVEALEDAADNTPGAWLTRREVYEAVGLTWINLGQDTEGQRVIRALTRLANLGQVPSQRPGTETTDQRPSHEAPTAVMTCDRPPYHWICA